MNNAIAKTVKRSNLYRVLAGIAAIIIAAVIIYFFTFPYFYAKFTGPYPITIDEILTHDGSQTLYFREITTDFVVDTGYYEYTYDEDTGRTISTDAWFAAIELEGDRWLFVRNDTEIDTSQDVWVGGLTKVSGEIAPEVFNDLQQEYPNVKFIPLMLDVVDNEFGWYAGGAGLALLLLGGVFSVFTGMMRYGNPLNHPTFQRLGRMGTVEDVVHKIEKEMTLGAETVAKLQLTNSYLIHQTGASFEAMRYQDIVWLYKMVKSGRYGKTYIATFCDKHGHQIAIQAKDSEVDEMLKAVFPHAPWALAGYTDDVNKAWNRDREQLIQAVEQRKIEIRQQQSYM
jgi:hypothetical protein